jgi:hypothetical protein
MMNKILSGLTATALAASFAIASEVPVNAAPVFVPQSEQVRGDVQQVRHDTYWGRHRHWRHHRRHGWRNRYYYDNDGYYAYRPRYYHRYYGGDYPRYYRRPGVSLHLSF